MKKRIVLGATSPELSQREIEHRALARKMAAESMVLLKNDNVLPLKPGKIALFGAGARMTVQGGSGSGDTRGRGSVSIEQGLLNAGFTIPKTLGIDRFENQFKERMDAWKRETDELANKYSPVRTMDMFNMIGERKKPQPGCAPILPDELTDKTDTAIYVLARQAGEGGDRKAEKGDYYMSDIEVESIRLLSEKYKKLILVINAGGVVDVSIIDEVRVDSLIFYGQAGASGGDAFADLVTGKVTPSGHLTGTWAMSYEDYPSAATYSHVNGEVDFENYYEGYYVGYRYFSEFDVKPRFPFGYGLSYTRFAHQVKDIIVDGTVVTVEASVKNEGGYKGKEVLQLYLDGELVSFNKTKELDKGEETRLQLSFNMADNGSFDEKRHSFVLHSGEYGLSIGNHFIEEPFAILIMEQEVITEVVSQITDKPDFDDMTSNKRRVFRQELPRYKINTDDFITVHHDSYTPGFSDKVKGILDHLRDKDKIALVVGGGYSLFCYNNVMGAAGRTAVNLLKKGIPNIILSDGPAGLNVVPEITMMPSGLPAFQNDLPQDWQWGWLKKISWVLKAKQGKGRPVYRYMTQWPCATLQAQSFNIELVEGIGKAIGREMLEIGVSVWLAPGMNIHRNPLCGRNFEYYSEDPYVSGKMAAAVTRGVQSYDGVGVSIKHYCCNNQEENRMMVSENVSEKALREIYLKGFRIAVEESKPWTVMSSYNKVNGIHVCNTKSLLTGVLRDEWGFDGLVMSDWNATEQCSYALAINAGNDLIMPGTGHNRKELGKMLADGRLNREALDISAARVLTMIFNSATIEGF